MIHTITKVTPNYEHVWGEYKEVFIDNDHILRSVRIYEDAYNSLHSHEVNEVQLVESGIIRYHYVENGVLKSEDLSAWSVTFVSAWTPHRIEFIDGNFEEQGVKFAQISEIVLWSNDNGNYRITRIESAKPWKSPNRQ
jgi:mannose-6-phosphate isomerase-like protein (cupin superfamily)